MIDTEKLSILIQKQVPDFVRDDYPKFVKFLEAYYEFLENKVSNENNDLISRAKKLRYVSDVDESLNDFETQFKNTFISLFPDDVAVDKALLIKKSLPFYLAKGSEKAFKFLFSILYGESVEIIKGSDTILRASDGKWFAENKILIENLIYSEYVGDANTKVFYLAQSASNQDVTVEVDGSVVTSGFYIQKEYKKLNFNTAPAANSIITVRYSDFDSSLFTGRKIVGESSGAESLIQKSVAILSGTTKAFDLTLDSKYSTGEFKTGEVLVFDILTENGIIDVKIENTTKVRDILIVSGGASYNVGDPIILIGGDSTEEASAVVGSIYFGSLTGLSIVKGGAGFTTLSEITAANVSTSVFYAKVSDVDDTGIFTPNQLVISSDLIEPYLNVAISSSDYGFPKSGIEDMNTAISNALSYTAFTGLGSISNTSIITSLISFETNPELNANGAQITLNTANISTNLQISSFGTIGKLDVISGGTGYRVGDELSFTNKPMSFGTGAAGAVTGVDFQGSILFVEMQPSRISGNVTVNASSNLVTGFGTSFTTELSVGDRIIVNNQSRYVDLITDNTSLNVNVSFTHTSTNFKIGKYGNHIIGGQGYSQLSLPTITVNSTNVNATGANIVTSAIFGDGELIQPILEESGRQPGEISTIVISYAGKGYKSTPLADMSGYGDGTAILKVQLDEYSSERSRTGKFLTTDSLLSSRDRKLQSINLYNQYSYLIKTKVEFSKYKNLIKQLIHPTSFESFSQYVFDTSVLKINDTTLSQASIKKYVSGKVNVGNNSIIIYGTNTKFNVANTLGILTIGSNVTVNNQIRTVNSIIDNTTITVSSVFTTNSNSQTMIILT